MRRILLVSACLGALVFSGTTTALAKGPHHHGHHRHGHGYHHHHHHRYWDGGWYAGYRGGYGGYCGPRVGYYPAYPAYDAPYYYGPGYSNFGFGVGGRNFSLWVQQ